ncbi:nucleoside monophosphate kinase [Tenacibaculum sp. nBUS_03]|uniref:nucleoside monophosphate kinase n=1 Tax=Tenacibaculum sp. nBUS_03 TaxID=3395320 RepID=UPI003EB706F3
MNIVSIECSFSKSLYNKLIAISFLKKIEIIYLPDLLRKEINRDSSLGLSIKEKLSQGELVKDEDVNKLIINKMKNISSDVIIMGYPITINQTELFIGSIEKLRVKSKLKHISIKEGKNKKDINDIIKIKRAFNRKGQFIEISNFDELELILGNNIK